MDHPNSQFKGFLTGFFRRFSNGIYVFVTGTLTCEQTHSPDKQARTRLHTDSKVRSLEPWFELQHALQKSRLLTYIMERLMTIW